MIVYEEEIDPKIFKQLINGEPVYTKGARVFDDASAIYKYTFNKNYTLSPFVKQTLHPVEVFNKCNVDIVPSITSEEILPRGEGDRWELLGEMSDHDEWGLLL